MKTSLITCFFLLLLPLFSIAQSDSTFRIKGKIDTLAYSKYTLSYLNQGTEVLDTITLDNNKEFEYSGKLNEPTIMHLRVPNIYNPKFAGDFFVYSFWIEPCKAMAFEGKKGWLVEGIYGLSTNKDQYTLKNSEIDNVAQQYRLDYKKAINQEEKSSTKIISPEKRKVIDDSLFNNFLRHNPDNYYSLYLLYNKSKFAKTDTEYTTILGLLAKLSPRLQSSYLATETERILHTNMSLSTGKQLPEFTIADTSSNPVSLSSFKGKYVLIDFWASWCKPCREQNPDLVNIYAQYRDKNFEILGISLDKKREDWLQAIRKDKLDWPQVSNLKGFDCPVAKQYYIHSIPQTFLLDPNGKILAVDVSPSQLKEKLRSLLD